MNRIMSIDQVARVLEIYSDHPLHSINILQDVMSREDHKEHGVVIQVGKKTWI